MKRITFITASIFFLASGASAGTMGPVEKPWTWFGTISAGPVWENGGKTQTLF